MRWCVAQIVHVLCIALIYHHFLFSPKRLRGPEGGSERGSERGVEEGCPSFVYTRQILVTSTQRLQPQKFDLI